MVDAHRSRPCGNDHLECGDLSPLSFRFPPPAATYRESFGVRRLVAAFFFRFPPPAATYRETFGVRRLVAAFFFRFPPPAATYRETFGVRRLVAAFFFRFPPPAATYRETFGVRRLVAAFLFRFPPPQQLTARPLECGDLSPLSFFASHRPQQLTASPLECGDLSPLSSLPTARSNLPRVLWSAATCRRFLFRFPPPAATYRESFGVRRLVAAFFFPSLRSRQLAANRPRTRENADPITALQNPHSLFARYLRKLAPIVSTSVRKSSSRSLLPSAAADGGVVEHDLAGQAQQRLVAGWADGKPALMIVAREFDLDDRRLDGDCRGIELGNLGAVDRSAVLPHARSRRPAGAAVLRPKPLRGLPF